MVSMLRNTPSQLEITVVALFPVHGQSVQDAQHGESTENRASRAKRGDQVDLVTTLHQHIIDTEVVPAIGQYRSTDHVAGKYRQEQHLAFHQPVHHAGFTTRGHYNTQAE